MKKEILGRGNCSKKAGKEEDWFASKELSFSSEIFRCDRERSEKRRKTEKSVWKIEMEANQSEPCVS